MSQQRLPSRNSRFYLEINGVIQAGFSEMTVPDTSIDIIEYRTGKDGPAMTKIPSHIVKVGNLLLKQGITDSLDLHNWFKDIADGKIETSRKNVSVVVLDEQARPVARWNFEEAWPTKYDAPDMNAKGNEIAIETLELAVERMVRVKA